MSDVYLAFTFICQKQTCMILIAYILVGLGGELYYTMLVLNISENFDEVLPMH